VYEHLETLRPDLRDLFSALSPVDPDTVQVLKGQLPDSPDEYWQFLLERGSGYLRADGEPFYFETTPVSAVRSYFRDELIFEGGARGDIWVFGWESQGIAYGFDSGDGWRLAEVDEYREVTHLSLSFKQFVEGLMVCYPQIAVSFDDGCWVDGVGNSYERSSY
jgi:hypothetical protein